jgi:hypothetical protein
VPDDLEADFLSGALERVGDTLPVLLLVVEDEDLGDAEVVLEERCVRLPLEVVRGHDARVVARAGRVVLLRLALLGTGARVREPDRGVRRADHRDARLVQDRDLDRGTAGVVRSDHAHDGLVLGVHAGVGGTERLVPCTLGRRRVVERLELDREVARLVVGVLEYEPNRVVHLCGLLAVRALKRQVGDDLQRLATATAAVVSGLFCRRAAARLVIVVAAAACCEQRERCDEQGENAQQVTLSEIQLRSSSITGMS